MGLGGTLMEVGPGGVAGPTLGSSTERSCVGRALIFGMWDYPKADYCIGYSRYRPDPCGTLAGGPNRGPGPKWSKINFFKSGQVWYQMKALGEVNNFCHYTTHLKWPHRPVGGGPTHSGPGGGQK